ncbi:3'(2'),5'-bisphosphate nucleotidase CysQ [Alteromonas oceanisediminis]|uniref:3'(2'),5'-bisphosphate nucleotidase CysQ n=1 Tax=Alteromonas oceanisediminis TaxID=2836180 RepID=UPI001BDA3FBF|nr:3'(2'),5'-bisphosphate nucleotidase CysQ [Alteromonas oceanisediminis]MBT0587508.1 3'(2'),5'-bisphosphate nucleotidase CysQ [Alteromonas oceanisediminis]
MQDALLEQVLDIAKRAGDKIMQIYARDFEVTDKADDSPLTEADLAAHHTIVDGLKSISDLPILSEESANIPWSERKEWQQYWLVDPLDGTKEFIKKNGEFTVNIALIDQGEPVMGVVYAPALEQSFMGMKGQGAWREKDGTRSPIKSLPHADGETWKVVGSRSHQSPQIAALLEALPGETELVAMGSSLKLCLVACNEAHLYPRIGPTSEWDTAAAHAVAIGAGAQVVELSESDPAGDVVNGNNPALRYNQKESLLNPYFLVSNPA